MDENRIKEAVKKAQDDFWFSICESFPKEEVPTGELSKEVMDEHDLYAEKAVRQWLKENHTEMKNK